MTTKLKRRLSAVAGLAALAAAIAGVLAESQSSAVTTKQQEELNIQNEIQSAQAAPRATKLPEATPPAVQTPVCTPAVMLPYPDSQIHVGGQGGPFGSAAEFYAVSSWAGSAGGATTFAVWSGETGVATVSGGTAAVDVYTESVASEGCGVSYAPVGVFTDASLSGLLTIRSINGSTIELADSSGTLAYFSLAGDSFSSTQDSAH